MMEFKPFQKLSRWSRDVVITEKLDGTNACVAIFEDGSVIAQSRNKIITPEDDNYGFAGWVKRNEALLSKFLGVGYHFGEWWGNGIQRNYGLKFKKFSLFNTHKWMENMGKLSVGGAAEVLEAGIDVVPILWQGSMDEAHIRLQLVMQELEDKGSVAAPGFMKPEGVVIFHSAGGYLFKKTFEKDVEGKGQQ